MAKKEKELSYSELVAKRNELKKTVHGFKIPDGYWPCG
jgi:hypothetical protein